jgi:hypothetical protein
LLSSSLLCLLCCSGTLSGLILLLDADLFRCLSVSSHITSNVIKGLSDVREVLNESSVKVYKADKFLYFLLRLQHRPLSHSGHLDWVHFYLAVQNHEPKVFYAGTFELAFVMSEENLCFWRMSRTS